MTHVMLDIETYGTRPGSVILSIGAVEFDHLRWNVNTFHKVANLKTCIDAGLTVDQETVDWWDKQTMEARRVIFEAKDPKSMSIGELLCHFNIWLGNLCNNGHEPLYVWGNGANFDNALVAAATRQCGLRPMWKHYNDRCYRTLKNLAPDVKMLRFGTHHDALNDAQSQAGHAIAICNALGIKL